MADRFEPQPKGIGIFQALGDWGLWDTQKGVWALPPEGSPDAMAQEARLWNEQFARDVAAAEAGAVRGRYRSYMG